VRGKASVSVRWHESFATTFLLADGEADVAVLADLPEIPGGSLRVAEADVLAVGDDIWLAGFPTGWKGNVPIVVRGTVAGVGEETWINADGTWGNSGGPVVVLSGSGPVVVGLVLGPAGQVHADLADAKQEIKVTTDLIQRANDPGNSGHRLFAPELGLATAMTDFVERHFRTGYLRIADAGGIRCLLGS
jgi:hypothetical protein